MAIKLTVNMYSRNVLCGHEAVEALDKYIGRLEKRKVKGITEKQAYALIKTAKVLRSQLLQTS